MALSRPSRGARLEPTGLLGLLLPLLLPAEGDPPYDPRVRRLAIAFLLLLLGACGPSGSNVSSASVEGPPESPSRAAKTEGDADAEATEVTRPEDEVVVTYAHPPPRRMPLSRPLPLVIQARREASWGTVREAIQERLPQHGTSTLAFGKGEDALEIQVWSVPPDMRVKGLCVTLDFEDREKVGKVLTAQVEGPAWQLHHGCDAETRFAWPWEDGAALLDLRPLLRRSQDALGGDLTRLVVALMPQGANVDAATFAEVRAVLALLGQEGIGTVDLGGGCPGCRGSFSRRHDVENALAWLTTLQAPEGAWSGADPETGSRHERGAQPLPGHGTADGDIATTAVVLLALQGAGYTSRGDHPYAKSVAAGHRFLRSRQRSDGVFGDLEGPLGARGHVLATAAVTSVTEMTKGSTFHGRVAGPALEALPRAVERGGDDPITLGAAAMALHLRRRIAEMGGDGVRWSPDPVTEDAVRRALEDLRSRSSNLERSAAAGGLALLGADPAEAGDDAVLPPDGQPFWHLAAAYLSGVHAARLGEEPLARWRHAMKARLVPALRRRPAFCYAESWNRTRGNHLAVGRVEATAWATLALELHDRYRAIVSPR